MTQEEKEVAWERINDQRRDDRMTEASKKSCFSCANWAALEDETGRGECRVEAHQHALDGPRPENGDSMTEEMAKRGGA